MIKIDPLIKIDTSDVVDKDEKTAAATEDDTDDVTFVEEVEIVEEDEITEMPLYCLSQGVCPS